MGSGNGGATIHILNSSDEWNLLLFPLGTQELKKLVPIVESGALHSMLGWSVSAETPGTKRERNRKKSKKLLT